MGQLSIQNLVKNFGAVNIIKGANLEINEGEFVVFVGPSGCGKSTILRMIAGLESISDGTISIDGEIVNDLPPVKRGISMVFQSYALYPHLTVYENIAFPLRVAKIDNAEIEKRVAYAAKVLQLEERLQHKPGALSGGQRQRVAIGRSIVREPKIFLFDEPLSNLDAALRADMRIELSQLHKTLGNTMVYVTHDQIEAMTMADKIVVLRGGNIEQIGSPLELYYKPKNLFVASFIGNPTMNFIDAEFDKNLKNSVVITIDKQNVKLPVEGKELEKGSKLKLGIRPENIQLGKGEITIDVKSDIIEQLGSTTVVYGQSVNTGDKLRIVLPNTVHLEAGSHFQVGFSASDCHLFDDNESAFDRHGSLEDFADLPSTLIGNSKK